MSADAPVPGQAIDFEAVYSGDRSVGTPMWDIGRPQSVFLPFFENGAIRGRVLDVGCGTGEHTLMAASLGLDATGIDIAAAAIAVARAKSHERRLNAKFLVADVLQLTDFPMKFDSVLDSGLFHILSENDLPRFIGVLRSVMSPSSCYFLLCFSDRQPGTKGPRRVSEQQIRSAFEEGWRVELIESAKVEVRNFSKGIPGWFARIVRL